MRTIGFLAVAASLLANGCVATYSTGYYLFSGKVVDRATGTGVPRAALCMAISPGDFARPPRIYREELPPFNGDISGQVFGRTEANRYLFLMADDDGNFSTVWREDWVVTRFLRISGRPSHLPSISFLAGAPGYSDGAATFTRTTEGSAFTGSDCPARVGENRIPAIAIEQGHGKAMALSPIRRDLLRTRYPLHPSGFVVGRILNEGEMAFRQNKFHKAAELYGMALQTAPDDPLALLFQADAILRQGENEEALRLSEEYLRKYSSIGFAHLIAADAAYRLLRIDLDRAHLIQAMQLDPEFPTAYMSLCNIDPRFRELPEGWPEFWKLLR